MSHLQYFSYPGFGEQQLKNINSNQAVRIGNLIEISGQGGWDPETCAFPTALTDEIAQAYSNVQLALTTAGGKGWEGVYKVRCYIALREGESWGDYIEPLVNELKKWCPNHAPILTAVEVKALYEGMRVEIEAVESLNV